MLWSEGEIITNDSKRKPYSLKVKIVAGKKYSGFTFKDVYPDWQGFNTVEFRLRNYSKKDEKLCIKITDLAHDQGNHAYNNRFNYCPALVYGENVISISLEAISNSPQNRKMNLAEISRVGFFMIDLVDDKTLYIDEITLKR